MTSVRSKEHYSYSAYADPGMAQSFDRRRFGGPIGAYVAGSQARVLANMVGRIQDRSIVDVGTGTGRAAILMARGGARVTAVDASEQMLEVARRRAAEEQLGIRFMRGDAHALQFADREFDVAICLRVLMHAPDWQGCLAELCRVAERLVIFDYPAALSVAAVESASRRIVHSLGARTEAYRVFSDRAIGRALERSKFRIRSVHRQFVLPIQFHKAIGSRKFTVWSEGVLDRLGLLKQFGSPVTAVAERCAR
ncbi:MAG TPA: methyltransferase domain-containing protein [Vicinamibacterales bacterium]|nr:methyltransferase domain-containing protein [Vicinamibacterales bacterium]